MTTAPSIAWLKAALGNPPFPWQERLLRDLLDGNLPRALDLPTGLGKTSVMAIWLVARASGVRSLPRRLVYVVDRRAVVDQATLEAERLRAWVASDPEVSAALGLKGRKLPISTLRGQFVDNREWLEDPSVPAIVVGTVDMVGSRLLFEGYACSRKMRPYHAGLLGADACIVLDEAHLVPPFERLLDQITETRARELGPAEDAPPVVPATKLLSLSATGRDHGARTFRLDGDDLGHPVVRRRMHATKRVKWEDLPPKTKLHEVLAQRAWELAQRASDPVRVVVFSNKREDAEKAREALRALARAARPRGADLPPTELLVGARRVRDRAASDRRLRRLGFVAGSERPLDHVFLFATSAGEVGVDLDADHMVADVVAWERMVQRLGRVNRRGDGAAEVVLVADPESPWTSRVRPLVAALPHLDDGHDASPAALQSLQRDLEEAVRDASSEEPLYPALTRPLVEAWAMTSLRDHTGRPEVQPWLRGWIEDRPQTSVVWRTVLPRPEAPAKDLEAYFEAAPPHQSERLDAEHFRVAAWLVARASAVGRREEPPMGADHPVAWVLDGAGELERSFQLADLASRDARGRDLLASQLAGRILIVDARLGGLSVDAHDETVLGLLDETCDAVPPTADEDPMAWETTDDGEPVTRFRVRVVRARESDDGDEPADAEEAWVERTRIPHEVSGDERVLSWLVVEKWRHDGATEDDRSAGPPQPLAEHQAWAAAKARAIADALNLPEPFGQALCVAARLHDEGKRAARWQRAFHARPDDVYAKTRGPIDWRLLDGYRHELGSLVHVRRDPEFQALTPELQDLVLHVVAAHHGFARPTIRTSGFDDAPPSVAEALAREVALRFVRLQARWGPWGLAWWETLLRAADQQASRDNQDRRAR